MSLLCAYISLGQQYYKTCVGCEIICVREIISDSWNEFSEKKKKLNLEKYAIVLSFYIHHLYWKKVSS